MQNAELFRRGVVVPLCDEAEAGLRSNDVQEASQVQHTEIKSQQLFEQLFELGFFDEINRRCNTLIDDYEEEFIEHLDVQEIVSAVDVVSKDHRAQHTEVMEFLNAMRQAAVTAAKAERPVLFVL